ncbi:hypothetical protein INR49_029988, partial [Caranx melampygus]
MDQDSYTHSNLCLVCHSAEVISTAFSQKVNNLCGEDGQLVRLRADLSLLNTSNYNLRGRLTTITLTPEVVLWMLQMTVRMTVKLMQQQYIWQHLLDLLVLRAEMDILGHQEKRALKANLDLLDPPVHLVSQGIKDQMQRERKESLEAQAPKETKVIWEILAKQDHLEFLESLAPKETREMLVQQDLQWPTAEDTMEEIKDLTQGMTQQTTMPGTGSNMKIGANDRISVAFHPLKESTAIQESKSIGILFCRATFLSSIASVRGEAAGAVPWSGTWTSGSSLMDREYLLVMGMLKKEGAPLGALFRVQTTTP